MSVLDVQFGKPPSDFSGDLRVGIGFDGPRVAAFYVMGPSNV